MSRANLLKIQLLRNDYNPPSFTPDDSWLLCSSTIQKEDEVFVFAEPELTKSDTLGRILDHLAPSDDGSFECELGVTLPDYLPDLDGKQEYRLSISTEGGNRDT